MIDCFLAETFLEYCSAVWCSAADAQTTGPCSQLCNFLTDGVFECDIAYRRSVAVLCMMFNIRCNPMHPLYVALPRPHVPERVTHGALVVHRYAYAPPRCRTSKYRIIFILLSVSLWIDHGDAVFDGVRLAGVKSRANAVLLA